jgi:hypothetical protein
MMQNSMVDVGGMVVGDMGIAWDSIVTNTINHCHMGTKWFGFRGLKPSDTTQIVPRRMGETTIATQWVC